MLVLLSARDYPVNTSCGRNQKYPENPRTFARMSTRLGSIVQKMDNTMHRIKIFPNFLNMFNNW